LSTNKVAGRDLIVFLNARLDEDWQITLAVTADDWGAGDEAIRLEWEDLPDAAFRHAKRHDPARVLREVEAGRRILDRHRLCPSGAGYDDMWTGPGPCPDLSDLADRWNDHPDYDPAWRP